MKINKIEEGNKITLIPEGMLDMLNSPDLEAIIDDIAANVNPLVIDFSKVEYISSSGLRVLLKTHKKMVANNSEMILTNINDSIKEVFELTGFSGILTIS